MHTASMEFGSQQSLRLQKTVAVEQCLCPIGYKGLSCEECDYGYTRVGGKLFEGECRKCDCNGHAATCDQQAFQCDTCQHNTFGDSCEICLPGYYGNPIHGTSNDCKPCKCPLEVRSNNFSPTCTQATIDYDKYSIAPEEYRCDSCPRGYEGAHCDRCSNGYFGNPLSVGDFCKPCDCNGNADPYQPDWCDHRTGECLKCLGNTAGWKCEKCLEGHYGNPLSGECKACSCNEYGSKSARCDELNGQCRCKHKYIGRTCSQCKDGFGNLKAGCRQCGCDMIGAVSDVCDANSGQCQCLPGVFGITCENCMPNHYGFSRQGCKACECHAEGAVQLQCDRQYGQCNCRPQVVGRKCNKCVVGYWNIDSGVGCQRCTCDPMGSVGHDCKDLTGQCNCKPGVGGRNCDACIAGFWGFSPRGCTKCFQCEQPGHVCDPDTGRCVCPPQTEGTECNKCKPGTWDYHPYRGCKACMCNKRVISKENINNFYTIAIIFSLLPRASQ